MRVCVMEKTRRRLQQKVVGMATATLMRSCDVIEGGALRSIVVSRAKLDQIVDQARLLCEDYIYCRLQVHRAPLATPLAN